MGTKRSPSPTLPFLQLYILGEGQVGTHRGHNSLVGFQKQLRPHALKATFYYISLLGTIGSDQTVAVISTNKLFKG